MSKRSSSPRRHVLRAQDILVAIDDIRSLLDGKTVWTLQGRNDVPTRAAYERLLEIISEASRHLPEDWKAELGPSINWRGLVDIGNRLRHGYDSLDITTLWEIYEYELGPLQLALERMIAAHGP
jgi:uncharacterized protein with HEPN domain